MTTPIDDGGSAFPVPDSHHANGQVQYGCNGMTLRDWFAGQALTAMGPDPASLEAEVRFCYRMADAMIAERAKGETK